MAFGFFQIQHQAAFVAVQMQKIRAHAGIALCGDITRVITLGRLDLDHVGTVISEYLRSIGAKNDRGKVDNSDAGEWAAHG